MENEFVSYTQALALKELGFNEPCFGRYIYDGRGKEWFLVQTQQTKNASVIFEGDVSVDGISIASPLYQQAFRWFREKYGLYSAIVPKKSWPDNFVSGIEWYVEICGGNGKEIGPDGVFSYGEAELACLKELIKIVKNG